ncbi:hypothetical protein FS749_008657 [Ceratobasidium sp. UAMH 11750]|nr:hypothetical protein FS749_008657 [Ceratobasidium sp. UAMH 11750]
MSEDEEVEVVGAGGKKTKEYQARAWDFVSDEVSSGLNDIEDMIKLHYLWQLIKICEAINRVPDPVTSKKTEWKRGPANVMEKNQHWIDEGHVYHSGPEWGDLEPSVKPSKLASKRVKTEAPPDLSLAQQTQGDWLQAKKEVENYWAVRRTEDGGK